MGASGTERATENAAYVALDPQPLTLVRIARVANPARSTTLWAKAGCRAVWYTIYLGYARNRPKLKRSSDEQSFGRCTHSRSEPCPGGPDRDPTAGVDGRGCNQGRDAWTRRHQPRPTSGRQGRRQPL